MTLYIRMNPCSLFLEAFTISHAYIAHASSFHIQMSLTMSMKSCSSDEIYKCLGSTTVDCDLRKVQDGEDAYGRQCEPATHNLKQRNP